MRNTHERAKHVLRPEERIYPTCFVLSQVPQPGQMSFPRKMDRPSAGREFECPRKLEIQNGERKRTEEEGRNRETRAKEKEEKEKTGSNVVVDVVAEIFLESIADRKKKETSRKEGKNEVKGQTLKKSLLPCTQRGKVKKRSATKQKAWNWYESEAVLFLPCIVLNLRKFYSKYKREIEREKSEWNLSFAK